MSLPGEGRADGASVRMHTTTGEIPNGPSAGRSSQFAILLNTAAEYFHVQGRSSTSTSRDVDSEATATQDHEGKPAERV